VVAVSAAEQKQALDALLETLAPSALTLPAPLLDAIPPRPPGWPANRELFTRTTGLGFDALAPATAASSITIGAILQPERAARLVQQHARDASLSGLDTVADRLISAVFDTRAASALQAEILRSQQVVVVQKLIALARSATSPPVRAMALLKLDGLQQRVRAMSKSVDAADRAQALLVADMIRRHRDLPDAAAQPLPETKPPPGSPL
jgi:hypothetical protein